VTVARALGLGIAVLGTLAVNVAKIRLAIAVSVAGAFTDAPAADAAFVGAGVGNGVGAGVVLHATVNASIRSAGPKNSFIKLLRTGNFGMAKLSFRKIECQFCGWM
jgi:hypothetical protein